MDLTERVPLFRNIVHRPPLNHPSLVRGFMGYDLHITRRKCWAGKGGDITAEEWLVCVQRDSELRLRPENGKCFAEWSGAKGDGWLDWSHGQIFTKNPDEALIAKMVTIAGQFGATVQGDDGEIYDGRNPPRQTQISVASPIAGWFSKLRPKPKANLDRDQLPFVVGDRVLDPWRFEHTIISIEPDANHGLGRIRSRRSSDATEHSRALIAHGFKTLTQSEGT